MSGSNPMPERGTPNSLVRVVELDADLQVLLDDVVDRDGRLDRDAARMGIFGEKRLRVLFDRLVGHIGNVLCHWSPILICIFEP